MYVRTYARKHARTHVRAVIVRGRVLIGACIAGVVLVEWLAFVPVLSSDCTNAPGEPNQTTTTSSAKTLLCVRY